jgi:hypothetical protein
MDTELNLMIVAGIAAVACIAIGLVVGLLRGHLVSQRIREQLSAANDLLKTELADARSHERGLWVAKLVAKSTPFVDNKVLTVGI